MSAKAAKLAKKVLREDLLIKRWKIVTGDKVQIIDGKEKGKTGIVKKCIRKQNRVLIEGVNLVKKHVKSTQDFKGGIFTKESPIHYSKVALVDPSNGEPTKVSIKFLEDGSKVRVARTTGTVIPKPEPAAYNKKRKDQEAKGNGPKDTPIEIAKKQTFVPPSIEDLD